MGENSGGIWKLSSSKVALAVLAGAGVSYGLYKLAFCNSCLRKSLQDGRSVEAARQERGLLDKVSGLSVIPSDESHDVFTSQSASNLEPEHLKMLILLLQTSLDPSSRKKALVTLGNSAAFSVNQDYIREMGGLHIIAGLLSDHDSDIKVQTLNALSNLSMNVKNQELLKVYVKETLDIIETAPLSSELQLAGLRMLTNMSVTNNYQYMMKTSVTLFLSLLVVGSESLQIQVLKVLVNLSANPDLVEDILKAQAPASLILLFDSCTNTEVLVRALTFVGNLKDSEASIHITEILKLKKDSLYFILHGETSQFYQKLSLLLLHPDVEVKNQVAKIMVSI
ncbi:armadillo repeat-containing protein 10 isoform X1 [Polypterus senegalus]|uniref:armadillo repeat-containing protein 10 isoform X1 n=1 Tax=Polypterus senegalus TaxID=55291 RepID=UPI0019634AF0|nr:armadillo repeat-containing protein 10 isoform X1 [Polypterus senegalus]